MTQLSAVIAFIENANERCIQLLSSPDGIEGAQRASSGGLSRRGIWCQSGNRLHVDLSLP